MKKKNKAQGVSGEALASYQQQCAAIAQDWARLRAIIDAGSRPDADKGQLESELIALKSRLACDYPLLTQWRKGGYGLSTGINKMLAGITSLSSLVDSGRNPESRVNRTWRDVQTSLQKVSETLRAAQSQLAKGKPAFLPDDLINEVTHRRFPVKKILKIAGISVAVIMVLAAVYVMRNFLGFWAPGAGDGIIVDASMSAEDKIRSVLVIMSEAFKQDDVDMFMTVIANDFKDEEGNGKTALRVALQAYHEKGDYKKVTVDWSGMELLDKDGFLYARPIKIRTDDGELTIHLGFKEYGGKLLVATGSAP